MSTPDHLKADPNKPTTIPSLAELRTRLLADETLAEVRRRDMASALASLAKALGRPPETVQADPATLRPMLAGLTPAMVGLKPGRWRNVLSLTSAAMGHFGIVQVQGRIREKPSPQWLGILDLLGVEAMPRFHLWRLARYCTQLSIGPDAVGDAVLAQYERDLETRSLVSDPARCARDAARAWNDASAAFPGWPRPRLRVPDNRKSFALALTDYAASLAEDIETWCEWLSGADLFQERPFAPLRPASVETRRRQVRAWLGALVRQGVKPQDLVDLAAAVTPARAKLALRFFWDRAGQQETVHLHQMAGLAVAIGRHWAKLPDADIERLQKMAKQVRPVATGMTSRNMGRLRQLEDPDRLRALLTLPETLMEKARRAGAPSVRSARLAQTAVAVELLLMVPMRLRNLLRLRIGVHLRCSPGQPMSVSIPANEVKNGVPIEASLPDNLTKMLGVYLDRYRPLLATEGGAWLFPGWKSNAPKSDESLRTQIQQAAAAYCGLRLHPHLFRHIAAWITLRHNPGAHGQVQRILGHKSLGSTMAFYSGLETVAALQHYDALIDRERHAPETAEHPRGRRGRIR